MNYELFYGVPAIAVGLSAISFSAALQKDAAPIPNALEATNTMSRAVNIQVQPPWTKSVVC